MKMTPHIKMAWHDQRKTVLKKVPIRGLFTIGGLICIRCENGGVPVMRSPNAPKGTFRYGLPMIFGQHITDPYATNSRGLPWYVRNLQAVGSLRQTVYELRPSRTQFDDPMNDYATSGG